MDRLLHLLVLLGFVSVVVGQNQQSTLPYRVTEEVAGALIGTLSQSNYMTLNYEAAELESYKYVFLRYPHDDDSLLNLEEEGGILTTGRAIDREDYCAAEEFCYLFAEVGILQASLEPVDTVVLQILLEDENDNAPFFADGSIVVSISEAAVIGSVRPLPEARDIDSPENGVDAEAYELITRQSRNVFRIEHTGDELLLILNENLDREVSDTYSLQLVAWDKGVPSLSGTLEITVRVTDYNDHEPVFNQSVYSLEVSEDFEVGRELLQVHASDEDIGLNGQVKYFFSDFTYDDIFNLDEDSGSITLISELDYELTQVYTIEVLAQDQNTDPKSSTATVHIQVLDVNDNSPRVQINTLRAGGEAQVLERQPTGTVVAHVSVLDDDSGANGHIACFLPHRAFDLQAIQASTQYKLITKEVLDRELQSHYSLVINCMDFGDPQNSQEATINVTVVDINDNAPIFNQDFYTASIPENNGIGVFILQVNASDLDAGDNGRVTYSIAHSTTPNYIEIDPNTGIMRSATILDYEDELITNHQIVLEVEARDEGSPRNAASVSVTINITDVNDQAPTFTRALYSFEVEENVAVGSAVDVVAAVDADSDAFNHFRLSLEENNPDAAAFSLDTNGVITTRTTLDRESKDTYRFHIYAIDNMNSFLRGSTEVLISLQDVNDNAPHIIYPLRNNRTIRISNKVPIGYDVIEIKASDNDIEENATLIYELHLDSGDNMDDRNFIINRDRGRISTNKDFSSEKYLEIRPVVYVKDMGHPTLSATVELQVIVDKSVPYQTPSKSQSSRENKPADNTNVGIIVGLTVSTAVIVIGLVIAIVLLRKTDRKNPQDAYIHTTIEPKPIPITSGSDVHSGKFTDEKNPEVGSDDTLNSNQSNDSGKGSSETDPIEHKQPADGQVIRNQRPAYNRSRSADRLSLGVPPSQHGTYLRPVPPQRSRAVSESSAQQYGIMPSSPLDYPDSLPLWHGSYDRVPPSPVAENVQLGRGYAHFYNGPSTPTSPAASQSHFQFPPSPLTHNNRQQPSFIRSAPSSPNALVGHEPFVFPLSLQPEHRSYENEGVYESYDSDQHLQAPVYPPSPTGPGQHHAPPTLYASLQGQIPDAGSHIHETYEAPHPHEAHDLSGHIRDAYEAPQPPKARDLGGQINHPTQQYLDQSGQLNNYSPNHYTQIHYPENSSNPMDLVV